MLRRGDRVEKYVVERVLGEGGMARVYLVRHVDLGSRHALKILQIRSPDLDARFEQEGRVQASVRHPHIVGVSDVLRLPQGPALVMDWVRGPSLNAVIGPTGLEVDDALAVFRALLHAVGFAHDHGTIHRDLKPENVLLETRGDTLVPRIADFGLARVLDRPSGDRRTRTGMSMGTPGYMPPEQMVDAARCDERSDLYALGAMLYEMLTGRVPYEGHDVVTVAIAHRERPHTPVHVLRPEVPQRICDIIDRLLQQDPADRYPTCAEVLSVLERRDVKRSELAAAAPAVLGPLVGRALRRWSDPGDDEVPLPPVGRTLTPSPEEQDDHQSAHTEDGRATVPELTPSPDTDLSFPPLASEPQRRSPLRHAWWIVPLLSLAAVPIAGLLMWSMLPGASPALEPATLTEPPEAPIAASDPEPEPVPDDEPEPEPVAAPAPEARPRARPAPVAVAEPPPPEPAAPDPIEIGAARFQVLGDAEEVVLHRDDRDYRPGEALPPGIYTIRARFEGGPMQKAGSVTVVDADRPVIRCAAGLQLCSRLP